MFGPMRPGSTASEPTHGHPLRHGAHVNGKIKEWSGSPAIRLAVYYITAAVVLALLAWWFPWFRQLVLTPGGVTTGVVPGTDGPGQPVPTSGTFPERVTQTAFLAVLALLGALIFTAPIVWIYTVMLRQKGYDSSFVRMLIMLPVVVAGVVQVVRGDLALAFALAGIVAAVRFRTTVKDLQDAVFAFAAIGIGLATGTGAFALAGALSSVVALLFYVAWHFHIGDSEQRLEVVQTDRTLAEALVPGEPTAAVPLGDKSIVKPVRVQDMDTLMPYVERLADYVRADGLRKKGRFRELLLVYTEDPPAARKHMEALLDRLARRWVEVDLISANGNEEGEIHVIEYLVRLKSDVNVARMTHATSDSGNPIRAMEVKAVRGMREQMT
jgi:hypothetical protein